MATAINPQILRVFAELEAMWQTRDFGRMRSFWLKGLAAPLYLAEEKKDFITSWEQFDAYFAAINSGSRGGGVVYRPLHSTAMGQGQEMVAFELEWTTQLKGEDAPIGGSVRGIALFEYDGQGWKLRAYIEAPLAPILYVRDLYKLVAASRGYKPLP
jgi:hypothetical protein